MYTSYIKQVYFTINLFKKYIVIFKIWMDNCRMVLAKMKQVFWKGSV